MKKFRFTKNLLFVVVVLLVVVGVLLFFLRERSSSTKANQLISETKYEKFESFRQWPVPKINEIPNTFQLRLVLDDELHLGYVPYQDLVIRAWNDGYLKNKSNKVTKISIPRVWEKPDTKELYFLPSFEPIQIEEGYSDKFLIGMTSRIDENFSSRERLVIVSLFHNDPEINPLVNRFFSKFGSVQWPTSFVENGDVSDLPQDRTIGHFLPITQLIFDIEK